MDLAGPIKRDLIKMATVHNLFAHQIYEVDFENYAAIQQDTIAEVSTFFGENFSSNYNNHEHPIKNGGVQQVYDERVSKEINQPNLKKLFEFITHHGKEYWNILGYSDILTPRILNAWVTSVHRGGFVASHNHSPIPLAGVFYIKADSNQGNLFVENPSDYILGRSAYKANNGYVPQRYHHEIPVTSGKLVLFPGWMKHFTKENLTDDVRISMAVNFGCQGQVWFTDLG